MIFTLGARVRLNEEGRTRVQWGRLKTRHGTIARIHDHGMYSVLWDKKESIEKWHESYLEGEE